MTPGLNSSALANAPSIEICDPSHISAHMSGAFRPNRSKVKRCAAPIPFQHRSLTCHQTTINHVRYGSAASVDAPPTEPVYLAMFTLAGSADIQQEKEGFVARAGSFCVLNPTRHLKIDLSQDFEQLTLRLSGSLVHLALAQLTGSSLKQPLEFAPRTAPMLTEAASLSLLVQCICDEMRTHRQGFSHPAVAQRIEEALIHLLLTQFPHNYSALLETGSRKLAPHFVKKAQAYIYEHLEQPLSVSQIAAAAGVSVRTLQNAFCQHQESTLTAYVRNLRLQKARDALQDAHESGLSVTDVALSCGFSHLSKFAHYYKERFGESPSVTLKR